MVKLGYVTAYAPMDLTLSRGDQRGFHQAQSLERQQLSIEYIGPLSKKLYFPILGVKHVFYNKFRKQWYTYTRDSLLVKDYARQISRKLSGLNVDIIFSPVSFGSQPIAYLECDQPIVIWTDATLAGALETHPHFSLLCAESRRDGLANEKAMLNRCSLAIYASEWAAETAFKHYQLDPAKVKIVPFGPNLECNRTIEDIRTIVDARPLHTCKLLFVGGSWHGKGGPVAFMVAKQLNKMGINTELTILGCNPALDPLPDFVKPLGYISKQTKTGLDKINSLYAESHFMILPSKAEGLGISFCEASSFGVPSLGTKVGGIPTAVKDGLNGKTFDLDADIEEYCTYVADLFSNQDRYKELTLSSFNEYQTRLNWTVAGREVKQLMTELI